MARSRLSEQDKQLGGKPLHSLQHLLNWLEGNGILSDAQNGFRPSRSCQEHMITIFFESEFTGQGDFWVLR